MIKDVYDLLKDGRIKEAIACLETKSKELQDWKLQSRLETLGTNYKYMLQYVQQGSEDPNLEEMYNKMLREAYACADQYHLKSIIDSGSQFSLFLKKTMQSTTHSFKELNDQLSNFSQELGMVELKYANEEERMEARKALYVNYENATIELFNKIFVSFNWTEEEKEQAFKLANDPIVPTNALAVMMSAITLSLIQMFDSHKYTLLINVYLTNEEEIVRLRALVGFLLASYFHMERLEYFNELDPIINAMYDSELPAAKQAFTVQMLFIITRETEKIGKKLNEEIIPNMMKSINLQQDNLKDLFSEEEEESNPEWEEAFNQTNKIMQELVDLQKEGADTYMSTFKYLKTYPFFQQPAHWFYPFDRMIPEVNKALSRNIPLKGSLLDLMLNTQAFCDSDKYSFTFTLNNLSEEQLKLMMYNDTQNIIENGSPGIETWEESQNNYQSILRHYIQDLYRFLKLWIHHTKLNDIFQDKLNLWLSPILTPFFENLDVIECIANDLFTRQYYEESADLYAEITAEHFDKFTKRPDIWQKFAFSKQKQNEIHFAIFAYKTALSQKPDDVWTLKQLAQCYKTQKKFSNALEYYQKLEQLVPDDMEVQFTIGMIHIQTAQYKEALKHLFKVDYLQKSPTKVTRAIGWCCLLTKDLEKAERHYQKLLNGTEATASDWLNMGHVYYMGGHIKKAIENYKEAHKMIKSHDEFLRQFQVDMYTLEGLFVIDHALGSLICEAVMED